MNSDFSDNSHSPRLEAGRRPPVPSLLAEFRGKGTGNRLAQLAPNPNSGFARVPPRAPVAAVPERNPAPANSGSRLPHGLLALWGNVVADLGFRVGDRLFDIETIAGTTLPDTGGEIVMIAGLFGNETFRLGIELSALIAMLQAIDPEIRQLPRDPDDAVLACELVASGLFSRMENALGESVRLISLQRGAERAISAQLRELLPVTISSGGYQWWAGLQPGQGMAGIIEPFARANQHRDEKLIDRSMSVCIGPVAMATDQVYRARAQSIVDCGFDPSNDVRGVLIRSDGKYWPVVIDDEAIEITGNLRDGGLMRAGSGSTLVTIRIGEVTLSPSQRLKIEQGTRILVARIPGNQAEVMVGRKALCHGELDIVDGSLAVRIADWGGVA
ncbi:MAG: FliM/FliN family flagellar motor switch protein [Nitratireductor sp.]|nr:FliM/FliN family flagellar motor switch protein [Nitratireductor sp.]